MTKLMDKPTAQPENFKVTLRRSIFESIEKDAKEKGIGFHRALKNHFRDSFPFKNEMQEGDYIYIRDVREYAFTVNVGLHINKRLLDKIIEAEYKWPV